MRNRLFWLTLLMLSSAILYLAGLDYGHPLPEYSPSTTQKAWLNSATVFHPDAFAYVGIGYRMMVKGDLFPSYYHNPSLNIYSDIALFVLSGALNLPHNAQYGDREIAPFSLYVMGEVLSALFSVLSVSLAYAAGRVAFNWRVGMVTAALVAFSPLSTQHAHYATPNAETIMLATAAFLAAFVVLKYPTRLTYILAGLMVGFTVSARYNAGVVGIVAALAMLAAWRKHHRWTWIVLGMAAIPLAFLVGTPGAIGQARLFLSDFMGILSWYKTAGGGPGWTAPGFWSGEYIHWSYTVLFVVGPIATLFALAGMVALLQDRRWWFVGSLVLYFLVYSVIVLPGKRVNANLLLPLITPIGLLAGYGLVRVWERLNRRYWVGLLIVLLIWPAMLSVWFAHLISIPDTRMQAQAWIYQHIPKGTTIHLLGSYNVPLDPMDYAVKQTYSNEPDDALVPADSAVIVYSDAFDWVVQRDPSLTENPQDVLYTHRLMDSLTAGWKEIALFPRQYWPAQAFPPDDVSYWHQMEIIVFCKPIDCPVQ
ncbi:MAG TPA: glycosyltransferase family 39 protein [Aggregatilineales bacterium]|nr:glycosyltransferase family 39 protein [Aggregatilineales bacterium]